MKVIQGDVILTKVSDLPEGLKKLETKSLQESEVTGHHHRFALDADVEIYETPNFGADSTASTITVDRGKYVVVNTDGTVLFHGKGFEMEPARNRTGDHNGIELKAGVYQVNITREWDYNANEAGRVVD